MFNLDDSLVEAIITFSVVARGMSHSIYVIPTMSKLPGSSVLSV
jgi:hypothetical protein